MPIATEIYYFYCTTTPNCIIILSLYLHLVTTDVVGIQPFEYFGAALASSDLNGDGIDELIVGSPLYTHRFTQKSATSLVRISILNNKDYQFIEINC